MKKGENTGDAEIARTEITRPDNAAPDSKGGHRETGQGETISQGWTSRDLTTGTEGVQSKSVPESTAAGGIIRTYVCDDGL